MSTPANRPATGLGLWDAVSIIIGIVIGATIFQFPPMIFYNTGGPWLGLSAWAIGGVVSIIGALCYAELATMFRTAGGDFVYISRAYGRGMGFIFAWAELSVIRTGGSIAAMAYIFAEYAGQLWRPTGVLGENFVFIAAAVPVLALTLINYLGMQPGRLTQNVLSLAKVVGLLGVIGAGVAWYLGHGPTGEPISAGPSDGEGGGGPPPSFALALVFVMYGFGGWHETAFVAAEVRNPRRNIVRALIIGLVGVTAIYLVVNVAYLAAFGYEGVVRSQTIASDLLYLELGRGGQAVMSVLVMISALGAINGLLFTGMRLYGTFGAHHRLFSGLADPSGNPAGSGRSLIAQAVFSLLLIALLELGPHWKSALASAGLDLTGDGAPTGIYGLIACTAPVFWLFFLMTGASLIILRYLEPDRPRPFRVPLYPVLPLLFAASSAFMLYRSAEYALSNIPAEAVLVFILVLVSLPLLAVSGLGRMPDPPPAPERDV